MLYYAYQTQNDLMEPLRATASIVAGALAPWAQSSDFFAVRGLAAMSELVARSAFTHERPSYGIETVPVGNGIARVTEEDALKTPFGTLLHFRKDIDVRQPRVLVVAPLSGHFATLLRSTVRTLLSDHDVYITDWHNARDVALADGAFGFDDYVATIIQFMEQIGPGGHIVAVCQPCVQVLAAAALMAEDENPAEPRSIVLMAGPVDVRANPTKVNELATSKPIAWFKNNLIAEVPWRFKGAGRRVYPGFVQLSAFMSMNMQRHVKAHVDLFAHLVDGNQEKAAVTREFYDEYFAVLDLPAEFYLETVEWIFQEARLATGDLTYRGRKVDPRAIRRTSLLTVEGERDDICGLGQTAAAHDLCPTIKPFRKRHHMQAGVGHYGVFSGRRWEQQIYPIVRNVILSADA
jgi:poly(3-hydroxybutyrate) depolymerase